MYLSIPVKKHTEKSVYHALFQELRFKVMDEISEFYNENWKYFTVENKRQSEDGKEEYSTMYVYNSDGSYKRFSINWTKWNTIEAVY